MTAFLYALQPAAGLRGRLEYGLTPWRRRRPVGSSLPRPGHIRFWSEHWQPPEMWVRWIEEPLRELGVAVRSGGAYDRFDLEVPGGVPVAVRLIVAVEEHGAGQQLVRIRYWPRWSWLCPIVLGSSVLLSATAAASTVWLPAIVFAALAIVVFWRAVDDAGAATAEIRHAIEERVGRAAAALAAPPNAS